MLALFTVAAIFALAFLGWNLYRRFGTDRIALLNERRRTTSKMVSRAEFVDGNRHLDVAIAVTGSTFFYENAEMAASIDLQWVREIEYDSSLITGVPVHGDRVLRLRSDSQTFEFVLPADMVARWFLMLPPRRALKPLFAPVAVAAT
jgi:hypothetical protein